MPKSNVFSLPNEKGQYSQPNKSDSVGDIFMSYGIDLDKGRISPTEQVIKLKDEIDNPDFSGYAGSIGAYSNDKYFAVSGKAFSADFDDVFGTWNEESVGTEPDSGNTIMDSANFDGLFLVSTATNIHAWNGSTWVSWWQGTLGQSALVSGDRHLLWVGPDGNLYIVDEGNKIYRVTPTGTITKTGNGTLDFSDTEYKITCAVATSNRSFIGTIDGEGEEAVIIEWDMSPSASTANKLHRIGTREVSCLAVWNDTVVAVLSNGKVKYFNGVSFVNFDRPMEFPVPTGYTLRSDDNFIHPNGWAIIDDLPHFLVTGQVQPSTNNALLGSKQSAYYMPAGVWCLDPAIGLYHRFSVGTGLTPQQDYGKMKLHSVGALYSLEKSESKFLASYNYYNDAEATSGVGVLVYHDGSNTQPSRGFLMTTYQYSFRDLWKKVELFHKKLATNEKIRVYSRTERGDIIGLSGVWSSTTTLNISSINTGIEKGNVAFIKMGPGSGQLLRVSSVEESSGTTTVTFTEPNSFAVLNDLGVCDFLNFKFLGEVSDTQRDLHEFAIPESAKSRKTQFLLEFQQVASNTMELDFAIITT